MVFGQYQQRDMEGPDEVGKHKGRLNSTAFRS